MKVEIDSRQTTEIILLLGMCFGFFESFLCHEIDSDVRDTIINLQNRIEVAFNNLTHKPTGGE